jgi:glucose-1-phosphate thymidylyltransferase
MHAIALAAGYATRLYPLTRDRPKPLLEIAGVPLLSRILHRVLAVDAVEAVTVVVNARFAPHFERWRRDFASEVPIEILNDGSRSEDDRLGAIGDLALAWRRLPADEDVLVVAGDNLLDFDLRPLRRRFAAERTPTLVVRRVTQVIAPSPYNEVELGANDEVLSFREKPADPKTDLAAIALYLFPSSVRPLLETYLREGGTRDAPGHFVQWLVSHTKVVAARIEGGWHDVGTPETLAAARRHFAGRA